MSHSTLSSCPYRERSLFCNHNSRNCTVMQLPTMYVRGAGTAWPARRVASQLHSWWSLVHVRTPHACANSPCRYRHMNKENHMHMSHVMHTTRMVFLGVWSFLRAIIGPLHDLLRRELQHCTCTAEGPRQREHGITGDTKHTQEARCLRVSCGGWDGCQNVSCRGVPDELRMRRGGLRRARPGWG